MAIEDVGVTVEALVVIGCGGGGGGGVAAAAVVVSPLDHGAKN